VSKKKNITTKHEKLDFSYSEYELEHIRPYQSREIEPVLSRLFKKNMAEHPSMSEPEHYDEYVNEVVTRYILIRNVGALEYYLRQIASMIVDNNGVDFSKFFTNYYDFETKLKAVNQGRGRRGRGKKLTRGQFFASQFNFVNPKDINWVFSRLLELKFFDTVKRINRYPLSNPWPGSIGFVRNWKKFMKMFEWRNRIVHSMELVQLSREELRSLCSNTLVFMEQASVLLDPPTGLGESGERDHFYRVITEERTLYREEQERNRRGQVSRANRRR
jgi:hypothetical protein